MREPNSAGPPRNLRVDAVAGLGPGCAYVRHREADGTNMGNILEGAGFSRESSENAIKRIQLGFATDVIAVSRPA